MTQSSRGTVLAAMASAGLLLGGAGAAQASDAFSVQETVTPPSQTFSFPSFNTSLGTLTEVDITLSNQSATIGSTFGISGGEGGSNGMASFTANLDITGPGSEALFGAAASSLATCTVAGGGGFPGSCSDGPVAPTVGAFTPNPVPLTSPTDLALWDTGSNVDVTASIDNFVRDDTCTLLNGGGGSCSQIDDVLFAGDVSVNYIYTPANGNPVPEPLSMALLGTGLVGLGFVRRRR